MRKFKVSRGLRQYITGILNRRQIPYACLEGEETFLLVSELSGSQFHKIVQRAKCEKKSLETGKFYITKEESQNASELTSLMQASGRTSFLII